MSIFCSRILSWIPYNIWSSCYVSLGFFCLRHFLRLTWFLMILCLKSTDQLFCKISLDWGLFIFSYDCTGVLHFGKKSHRGKMLFSSHHIKGTYNQYDLYLLFLALATWIWSYPLLFLYCIIWKEVTVLATFREWGVLLYLPGVKYVYKFFGIFLLRKFGYSNVCICLIICVHQHGLIDIYFVL